MRKTLVYTVPGARTDKLGERDNGKTFVLTELAADQAERWALRAILAIGKGGYDVPPEAVKGGMATLAAVGLGAIARMSYDDARPLLDEMMECVRYQHAPNMAPQRILDGDASQIEEVKTRVMLRGKLFELHTGFSLPVVP